MFFQKKKKERKEKKKKKKFLKSLCQKINRYFPFPENPFTSPRTRMGIVCWNLFMSKPRSVTETKGQAAGWS